MLPEELEQLLTTAGYRCRNRGKGEVAIAVCIFCGNEKWNLELNPSIGVYHCWACRSSGRLAQLLERITGQRHNIPVQKAARQPVEAKQPEHADLLTMPVEQVGSALRYLEHRGLPLAVARQYGLVVCTNEDHQLYGRILVPMGDFWSGARVGWIGRSYTGQHPKYLSTFARSQITGWRVRAARQPTVIVEGPFDGMAVHRANYNAAVLAGTHAAEVEMFVARLPADVPLVIMLDPEAADSAAKLYWKLLPLRAPGMLQVAQLPAGTDPGDLPAAEIQRFVEQITVRSGPDTTAS